MESCSSERINENSENGTMDKYYFDNQNNVKADIQVYATINGLSDPDQLKCSKEMLKTCAKCQNGEEVSLRAYLNRVIVSYPEKKFTRSSALTYLLEKSLNFSRKEIKAEEIKNIIRDFCSDNSIDLPDDFNNDADQYFPSTINSFSSLKVQFCRRINTLLRDDQKFADKYRQIYKIISEEVRLKLLIQLGLEEYACKPLKGVNLSPREILSLFLKSLKKGEEWNTGTLSNWHCNGRALVDNLTDNFSTVPQGALEILIGNDADRLLTRNPLSIKGKKKIKSDEDVAYYLEEFLRGLEEGQGWFYNDLLHWQSEDGISGHSIKQWMLRNKGAWSERTVRALLGEKAETLLSSHPFKKGFQVRN